MSLDAQVIACSGPSAEAVEALSASKHEPAWMRHKRLTAWELSQTLSMPLGNEEIWRRTDLRGLDLADYLERFDDYSFFERTGDLIFTGPTHANVSDLMLLLSE